MFLTFAGNDACRTGPGARLNHASTHHQALPTRQRDNANPWQASAFTARGPCMPARCGSGRGQPATHRFLTTPFRQCVMCPPMPTGRHSSRVADTNGEQTPPDSALTRRRGRLHEKALDTVPHHAGHGRARDDGSRCGTCLRRLEHALAGHAARRLHNLGRGKQHGQRLPGSVVGHARGRRPSAGLRRHVAGRFDVRPRQPRSPRLQDPPDRRTRRRLADPLPAQRRDADDRHQRPGRELSGLHRRRPAEVAGQPDHRRRPRRDRPRGLPGRVHQSPRRSSTVPRTTRPSPRS